MNILLIGATGSTGLYLMDSLRKQRHKVFATGRRRRENSYFQENRIPYFSLDISKKEEFQKLDVYQYDVVVLLAGLMPARMEGYKPESYFYVNTLGTLHALEYCRSRGINKIIFAQSHSDVAGHWNTGRYIKDEAERILNLKGDHAAYIISKCAAVDLLEHYHQEFGLQSIIFRLPTIYCYWPDSYFYVDGMKKKIAYLAIIEQAINGEKIEIWGDPSVAKDIVYIKDFVQLLIKSIEHPTAQGIFNVGTGIPTTLEEQILGIIDVFSPRESASEVVYCPEKPSQVSYLYDITKAKKELGYVVEFPYKEMLEDMKIEMKNPIFELI